MKRQPSLDSASEIPFVDLQKLLRNYDSSVEITGVLDDGTKDALLALQKSHLAKSGRPLRETGEFDPETIEALQNSKRRAVVAAFNFGIIISLMILLYRWNRGYWTSPENSWKATIEMMLVCTSIGLFGFDKISAKLNPASSATLIAAWHRWQSHFVTSILLVSAVLGALYLNVFRSSEPVILPAPPPRERQVIHIGVMLNGTAPYAEDIYYGFRLRLTELLEPTNYSPHFEMVIGEGELDIPTDLSQPKYHQNLRQLDKLLENFPENRPNYLVTIGTNVSAFVKGYLKDNPRVVIPQIFIGVTNPQDKGVDLIKAGEEISRKEKIAGTTYGPSALMRAQFLAETFPSSSFGFIYNPNVTQDESMKNQIINAAASDGKFTGRFKLIPINDLGEITPVPPLTDEQKEGADIFFGYYSLNKVLSSYIKASPEVPFVGVTTRDVQRSAIASIVNDDEYLGARAAAEILAPTLLEGRSLGSIPIISPDRWFKILNEDVRLKFGIEVPPGQRDKADRVFTQTKQSS